MGFERSFDEKIDVIDLIINVLKDHEAKLDELVSRLEEVQISQQEEEPQEKLEPPKIHHVPEKTFTTSKQVISTVLKRWSEFINRASSAKLVAFDTVDEVFEISAYNGEIIYIYREEIPNLSMIYTGEGENAKIEEIELSNPNQLQKALNGKLDCGFELTKNDLEAKLDEGKILHQIKYNVDPVIAKNWIAYQLEINDVDVIQGKIYL